MQVFPIDVFWVAVVSGAVTLAWAAGFRYLWRRGKSLEAP